MIITQEKSKEVISSHNFQEVNCTIDAEDMRYVASLLRNNYSNTRLAVVREISANALDANAEAGSSEKIEVKIPSSMNPTFAVRDFGGGLSEEDVFGLYSKYGKSTKRDSNNYIGAFGIGKFAPLSYGDNFTCVSYHGGTKTTYNVFVNEDDDTKISRIGDPELSSEPTGLSIEVAVADSDINMFKEICQTFFIFFSDRDMPKFIGVEDDFIPTPKKLLESKTDDWFFIDESNRSYNVASYRAKILMGRVAYNLDPHSISVENHISDEKTRRIIEQLLNQSNFYVRVPLGSVRLHHSREALEYNKQTQKEICRVLLEVSKDIQVIAKEKLADSEDLWDAKKNYAKVVNALPYQIRNIFENAFEWNGIKILDSTFQRDYQLQDDLILTNYEKIEDKDSRNGFKLKAQKTNRIYCQENCLILIQDLASSHGNNLRVRSLMNDHPNLESVCVLNFMSSECAKSEVYDNWQLDLVDAKHKRYTSQVEKEKIIRNKVSGSKSRASIPLFKMKSDKGHAYRNADYWQNVSDPINSLELDDVEGSINGKIIYVPITRYTIEGNDFDLDRVYKMSQAVRRLAEDNTDQKTFTLFGVRKGDVKKLDNDVWVSFFDFYLDTCKKIAKKNLKESKLAYKKQELRNSNLNFHEYEYNLGKLLSNKTLDLSSLPNDHAMVLAQNDWESYSKELNASVANAINHIRNYDENWLKQNFNEIKADQFDKNFKSVISTYPLMRVISENCSQYWVSLESEDSKVTNKMILDYISLCDGVGA